MPLLVRNESTSASTNRTAPAASTAGQSPLAQKFPPLKKTGDATIDNQLSMQRAAFVKIIDKLWFSPELIVPTCIQLECGRIGSGESSSARDEYFDEEWQTLSRLPKHWLAEWIVANSAGEISLDELSRVGMRHGDNIRNMLSFLLGRDLQLHSFARC